MHIWKVLKPSPYRRDCGTGAGGFQPGNSCAGGGSGSASNAQEGKEGHTGKSEEKLAKKQLKL